MPYVHVGNFVKTNFGEETDKKMPIMCIGITSGIGRLVFGYIADRPKVNRILLQQVYKMKIFFFSAKIKINNFNCFADIFCQYWCVNNVTSFITTILYYSIDNHTVHGTI